MQFREGANVLTANRENGEVDRVVLYSKTKEVTHLVKGFLFTEEKSFL